ncbi:hypothetical protein EYF80_009345 [Liparis tanakae]|uniref:Uncharacterized protein n=1 Tax=Liparis tanakae TaxID=230148 RepID=A0A4Z2IR68_9TELE|nr:hypothetical protein EYF80_009345 [Liparis tanakae]
MASGVNADNLDSSGAFRAHNAPQPPMRNTTSPALNIKKLTPPARLPLRSLASSPWYMLLEEDSAQTEMK